MASKLNTRHVKETLNFHLLQATLSNGDIWQIYVPKDIRAPKSVAYVDRFPKMPRTKKKLEPDPVEVTIPCTCVGAHYHMPITVRRKTTRAKRKA
jgi:hypothetical protein